MSASPSETEGVSIVIPAFNEEPGIGAALREIHAAAATIDGRVEVLVVDDGSQDRTAEVARAEGARVLSMPVNRGYGAALKAGIRQVAFDTIVITDADGTYPADMIPKLVAGIADYDMVVGARSPSATADPLSRRPAKWVLRKLAGYLAGQPIPDLNSGLRAMKRDLVERYEHLLPSGFSFTTTITLASLCRDHLVAWVPIEYRVRKGNSKIRPWHAFDFLLLILRTIVYFNPLKVFLPMGGLFFAVGFVKTIYDVALGNLSESAIFGFLAAGLIWALGLISDQISRMDPRGRG